MSIWARCTQKGSERRKHIRKDFDDQALIMFFAGETDIIERAKVQDISHGGICFNGFAEVNGYENDASRISPDQHVVAYIKNASLTVFGTVKRVDDQSGRLALVVRNSTNKDLWYSLCE